VPTVLKYGSLSLLETSGPVQVCNGIAFPLPFTSQPLCIKVNCTLAQALRFCTGRTAHRESRGIALLFLDHGTRRGEGSASHPGRSLPPGKSRYPLYRRLRGPQGRSGQVRKISPPPGFDPRTFQPVASRNTDYATRHTLCIKGRVICRKRNHTCQLLNVRLCVCACVRVCVCVCA